MPATGALQNATTALQFANEFTASRRYFYVFCLDGSGRWGSLFFQHQPVSIANVFFQLLERRALTKDIGYLWQAPDVPVAILPILKTESNSLRHGKFGGGGGSCSALRYSQRPLGLEYPFGHGDYGSRPANFMRWR